MITAQSTSSYDFSFAIWFYALISIWFLVQIARGIIYLVRLERHSEYQVVDGIPVYRASNIQGSFTFFNRIFMDQTISSDQEEFTPMLNHESAHARLGA